MIMEANNDDMMANGWPLGLRSMISRFRTAAVAAQQPQQFRSLRSRSFSSFSSSNLDTESTASFFPDQSVSLGKLIGIRPLKKKVSLCCDEEHRKVSDDKDQDFRQGLCAPLLHHVIGKKGSSGGDSKRQ
ncbi:uncharacterized protein LOC127254839 [Andrographis paniculata]|uniref:uncharacterized protein LOC127254839 n=1 Tax=Andrographis paniculata TaxID=175694 RepID=UPI0021E77705|nr:uncharacterized protein LOC127254839 [Andrographis paniculata]